MGTPAENDYDSNKRASHAGVQLLLLYFGWDALLAVELSFSYAAARVSVGVERQGWVSAALRLTWKPLAAAAESLNAQAQDLVHTVAVFKLS